MKKCHHESFDIIFVCEKVDKDFALVETEKAFGVCSECGEYYNFLDEEYEKNNKE